jgi:aquaporin Z
LAAGSILAALVYLFSDISGSHYNPAVTIAAWVAGKLNLQQMFGYIFFQLTGAIAGAFAVWRISDSTHIARPAQSTGTIEFIAIELLFSLFFVLIFLYMVYPAKKRRNPVYGIMIGLTFAAAYIIAEPISGTGLNPATTTAFIIADTFNNGYSHYYLPIYLLAPLVGGLTASAIYSKLV